MWNTIRKWWYVQVWAGRGAIHSFEITISDERRPWTGRIWTRVGTIAPSTQHPLWNDMTIAVQSHFWQLGLCIATFILFLKNIVNRRVGDWHPCQCLGFVSDELVQGRS